MDKLIFELQGPEYDLASAEVRAVFESLDCEYSFKDTSKYVEMVETDCGVEVLGERLGLTHRIMDHGTAFLEDSLERCDVFIDVPEGSCAVDTRRLGGKKADSVAVRKKIGSLISESNEIDLTDPENVVLVLISDRIYLGRVSFTVDKESFRERKVKNREFFSPISLEPWYARAMVNLGRVSPGDTVHDPFCGTGGLLIEAGMLGLEVSGGDLGPEMVEGCRRNLHQFGLDGELVCGDVSETVPSGVDCVITDPPYGRASSTGGEDIKEVYQRLLESCNENLKEGGYLSTIFPEERFVEIGEEYMKLVEKYESRVHGSLKRIYCVFRN
ncbi:MAG: methyltransferase [Candidatus Saliniplasma sp.]